MTEALCDGGHASLDANGRHRAACSWTGRLEKRATLTERTLMFREAEARDGYNAFLRDMNVEVPVAYGRRIEVLAQDLLGGVLTW